MSARESAGGALTSLDRSAESSNGLIDSPTNNIKMTGLLRCMHVVLFVEIV